MVVDIGEASSTRGFSQVVNLLAHMQRKNDPIPLALQTALPSGGRYDQSTQQALIHLSKLAHLYVEIYSKVLPEAIYRRLLRGAVAILAYDIEVYSQRVSSVLLDTLYAGAPVITVAGTTMADVVNQFKSGIVVDDREPATLYRALKQIQADYAYYRANCLYAKSVVWQEHKPETLLQLFAKYLHS